jgi:hypothetical protein
MAQIVKEITTTVSADGRTRVVKKDVNGNGTTDQTETAVTDGSGAVVTTTVNNAEARDLANLLAGEIYWKQAVAAKVITTTSKRA